MTGAVCILAASLSDNFHNVWFYFGWRSVFKHNTGVVLFDGKFEPSFYHHDISHGELKGYVLNITELISTKAGSYQVNDKLPKKRHADDRW